MTAEAPVGRTGTVGVDGVLDAEQADLLNRKQESAANAAFSAIENRKSTDLFPLIGMATGIGKGNIIHRLIEKQMRKKADSKVLLIAGTKITLVNQTHMALADYQDQGSDYISAEDDEALDADTESPESNPLEGQQSFLYRTGKYGDADVNTHIATVQRVVSEAGGTAFDPDSYDLVIVDEVHNMGTKPRKALLQRFKNVVGLTATPYRHSGKFKKPKDYGFEQVVSYTLPEAQEDRLLPPLVGVQINTKEILDEIPTNAAGAIDYRKLEKVLKEHPDLRSYIADKIAPIISNPDRHNLKTVIAVNFVWEAEEMAKLLAAKGIKVGVAVNQQASKLIHSEEIPALDSIERYKLPEDNPNAIQVLISPYVASEGFDAPFTEALVWASPTDSELRYTQFSGRNARRAPGKKYGLIVDCLYQTSQFGWSYNMGMWMKGNVRQLDNGLLYMGPESDIEGITQSPIFTDLLNRGDTITLEDLEVELGLEPIGDDVLALTQQRLSLFFVGSPARLVHIARGVQRELSTENTNFFGRGLNGSRTVTTVTDLGRERFFAEMKARGVDVRDTSILQVQATDFTVMQRGHIDDRFVGGYADKTGLLHTMADEVEVEHPDWFIKRKKQGGFGPDITIVQGPHINEFEAAMIAKGATLRNSEIELIKATDLPLTDTAVRPRFRGGSQRIMATTKMVADELEIEHPEWFVERDNGRGRRVKTIATPEGQAAFMAAMQANGVHLREGE